MRSEFSYIRLISSFVMILHLVLGYLAVENVVKTQLGPQFHTLRAAQEKIRTANASQNMILASYNQIESRY